MTTNQESIQAGHALRAAGGETVQWLVIYRRRIESRVRARVVDVLPSRSADDVWQLVQAQHAEELVRLAVMTADAALASAVRIRGQR